MSAGCAPAAITWRITSTWPRCTPSKLPTVRATAPMWLVGSPRWTFRGVRASGEHLLGYERAPQWIGVSQRDEASD